MAVTVRFHAHDVVAAIDVENARRKRTRRRGGSRVRQDLDALDVAAPDWPQDRVALDEALDKLAADKRAAELGPLSFFAGLPLAEVVQHLGISPRTADRLGASARLTVPADPGRAPEGRKKSKKVWRDLARNLAL